MKTPEEILKTYPELYGFLNDSEWNSMIEAMKEYTKSLIPEERVDTHPDTEYDQGYDSGWNACIDEMKDKLMQE